MRQHSPTAGARLQAVGGTIRSRVLQCVRKTGAAGVGGLPWPGRLCLRQTCGGGAKGAYSRCAPSCPLQPGSVEDQDYSMVQLEAPTRGGPAQTRRCTDGMDRGCSAMHGMDADAPLSESPRGWAGRIERRWRLRRDDRKSHRRARDRKSLVRAGLCSPARTTKKHALLSASSPAQTTEQSLRLSL
jgi:hypothetical protein